MNQIEQNQSEKNQSEQTSRNYTPPKLEQHPAWCYVIGFSLPGAGRDLPAIPEPTLQTK